MKKTIYDERYIKLVCWLKDSRKEKGITMEVLADKMGCAFSFVSKYEKNQVRLDVLQYYEICTVLEIDPAEGLKLLSGDVD
jgi:transcriptional regulator with XRE-family HTH domain